MAAALRGHRRLLRVTKLRLWRSDRSRDGAPHPRRCGGSIGGAHPFACMKEAKFGWDEFCLLHFLIMLGRQAEEYCCLITLQLPLAKDLLQAAINCCSAVLNYKTHYIVYSQINSELVLALQNLLSL